MLTTWQIIFGDMVFGIKNKIFNIKQCKLVKFMV